MNRVFCDVCGKEMPAEDWHDETLSYTDFLKEKGEGGMIISVERVMKTKSEDHYWTKQYDLCPECQKKVDRAVRAVLDG